MPECKRENSYKELQEHELYVLTEFFKMLGDSTRIHLLFLLMEQEVCVSDLANWLGMTQVEPVTPKNSRRTKPRFIVTREYSGGQSMRTAFEQAIESQACGQFEIWLEKQNDGKAC